MNKINFGILRPIVVAIGLLFLYLGYLHSIDESCLLLYALGGILIISALAYGHWSKALGVFLMIVGGVWIFIAIQYVNILQIVFSLIPIAGGLYLFTKKASNAK